jgi:hypothetical protein
MVTIVDPKQLRAFSCGSRFLVYTSLHDITTVKVFPCFESEELFAKFAAKGS